MKDTVFQIVMDPETAKDLNWTAAAINAAKDIKDTRAYVELRANQRIKLNKMLLEYVAVEILRESSNYGWAASYFPEPTLTLTVHMPDLVRDEREFLDGKQIVYKIEGDEPMMS